MKCSFHSLHTRSCHVAIHSLRYSHRSFSCIFAHNFFAGLYVVAPAKVVQRDAPPATEEAAMVDDDTTFGADKERHKDRARRID